MMRRLGISTMAAIALAAGISQPLRADENKTPVIGKVTLAFTSGNPNPTEMVILGQNFGAAKPVITLDGIPQTVITFSDMMVTVAPLSPATIAAGTYRLTLLRLTGGEGEDQRTAQFDVSIGAVGPQGPQGIQGVQGPQGPAGLTGGARIARTPRATGSPGGLRIPNHSAKHHRRGKFIGYTDLRSWLSSGTGRARRLYDQNVRFLCWR